MEWHTGYTYLVSRDGVSCGRNNSVYKDVDLAGGKDWYCIRTIPLDGERVVSQLSLVML
jgi:hypothetical protein